MESIVWDPWHWTMKRYIYLFCSMRIMVLTFFNALTEINVLVKYKKLLNVESH